MKKLQAIGYLFLGLGTISFLLGLSTYFWAETNTTYYKYESNVAVRNGYQGVSMPGVSAYAGGDIIVLQNVEFRYNVSGQKYESNFIGFRMPFNNDIPKKWGYYPIYYFQPFPRLSVLVRGPDIRLFGLLCVLGGSLLYLRWWIINVLYKEA